MKETPVQKRDFYVQRQIAVLRASGETPDVEKIAKDTASILGEMDKLVAGAASPSPRKRESNPAEVTRKKEEGKAASIADRLGGRFRQKALPARDKPRGDIVKAAGIDPVKHAAVDARIRLLCTRSAEKRLRPGVDAMDAADFEFRKYAMEIVEETFRHELKLGDYKHLSAVDRYRRYFAQLERIADRSNGAVGVNWWVK